MKMIYHDRESQAKRADTRTTQIPMESVLVGTNLFASAVVALCARTRRM